MPIPLQVTFRGLPASEAMEARIREKVDKLERFHPRITRCHVTIEVPHRHRHHGIVYHAQIHISAPGEDVVISRDPERDGGHADPYVALRDAFAAARRKLEDHARRARGDVKTHEELPVGRVIRVVPTEEYGFLETDDGLQVYFHKNALIGAQLDELDLGSVVRFAMTETESPRGPQATTVVPLR